MTKIVVLGWGSLIWDPKDLGIERKEWFKDGPFLPIEFARASRDGRLTLVIFPGAENVQVLWNYMITEDLEEAIKNLGDRENIPEDKRREKIGFVEISKKNQNGYNQDVINTIKQWAKEKNIDRVIWTDLGPNFKESTKTDFTEDNVINHLLNSEKYIRKTPAQIRTKMRKIIEERLGWTYNGNL